MVLFYKKGDQQDAKASAKCDGDSSGEQGTRGQHFTEYEYERAMEYERQSHKVLTDFWIASTSRHSLRPFTSCPGQCRNAREGEVSEVLKQVGVLSFSPSVFVVVVC
jgi:hypothetical protein